jgi:hypothetical protein
MNLVTIEGTYKDGKIELTEHPGWLREEAPVLVTFLPGKSPGAAPKAGMNPDREALRQRAFARMEEGLHLGGPVYPCREELYDRFDK